MPWYTKHSVGRPRGTKFQVTPLSAFAGEQPKNKQAEEEKAEEIDEEEVAAGGEKRDAEGLLDAASRVTVPLGDSPAGIEEPAAKKRQQATAMTPSAATSVTPPPAARAIDFELQAEGAFSDQSMSKTDRYVPHPGSPAPDAEAKRMKSNPKDENMVAAVLLDPPVDPIQGGRL